MQWVVDPGDQGRGFRDRGLSLDDATLTDLLQEAEMHHGRVRTDLAPKHHWSTFYAAYIVARENGESAADAEKGRRASTSRARADDLDPLEES